MATVDAESVFIAGMLDACPLPMLAFDRDARCVARNSAADRAFGIGTPQLVGRAIREVGFSIGETLLDDAWRRAIGGERCTRGPLCFAPVHAGSEIIGGLITVTGGAASGDESSATPARAILDALPNALFAYDRELRITEWNAATASVNHLAREEVIGRGLLDVFPYIRGTPIEEEHRRTVAGEVIDARDRCWTPTGHEAPRWYDVLYLPLRDATGVVTGGVVATTDVTSRREAEDELANERRLLRTVIDSAPFGLLAFDAALCITEWNALAERAMGLRRAVVIGRRLVDVLPGIEGTQALRDYQRALAGETVAVRERWYASPNGGMRCYDAVFAPMHDGRGTVIGGVMIAIDVTARVHATAERDRLTRIVEATPDVVAIGDARAQTLTYVNRAGRELLGIGPQETDIAVREFLTAKELAFVFDVVVPTATRDGVWRGEISMRTRDGRTIPMSAVVVGHADATGAPAYLSGILRDMTVEKRHEAELAAARERAEQASGAKSAFLAGMSHELRTPLGAVIGFAQLLRDGHAGPLTEKQREYLDDVLIGARHLRVVVDDTVDLARIEAGIMDIRPEPVDLGALVDEAIVTVSVLAAERGVALEREIDPHVQYVVADPARVRQVLLNYLTNAIKFNRPGGRARVEVAAEGDGGVRLSVWDTGRGIAQDDLTRLFVEFQRLGVDDVGGSGLGLAITRRIVEAMGGAVQVESTPGAGSAFHAVLPVTPDASVDVSRWRSTPAEARTRSE
ncbi:MAG TPA: PAS domain-containing protein [Gemmatimonadaceae bacterium]|nr:PAS domain-containing protein [Gemmatimonadaceae bacterium]